MKIKSGNALISEFLMKQFKFEAINKDSHNKNNIVYIVNCLSACKIELMDRREYYRARRVSVDSPGITYINGVPINGFTAEESGLAPKEKCKVGRANDEKEQVLYVSEDEETAVKEVRTPNSDYASVATCLVEKDIKVFDFSPYTEQELERYVATSGLGKEDTIESRVMLFILLQRILTLQEYSEYDYLISRHFNSIIKEHFPHVSGIKYVSQFTGKINYALWDENKYLMFTNGHITVNNY